MKYSPPEPARPAKSRIAVAKTGNRDLGGDRRSTENENSGERRDINQRAHCTPVGAVWVIECCGFIAVYSAEPGATVSLRCRSTSGER